MGKPDDTLISTTKMKSHLRTVHFLAGNAIFYTFFNTDRSRENIIRLVISCSLVEWSLLWLMGLILTKVMKSVEVSQPKSDVDV